MKKILAIGCGGAGMFSLIVASQLKKGKFQTTVLSDEKDIYCRCTSPYVLTGEAEMKDAIQPESMICDYGVKIVHARATSINTKRKYVLSQDGRIFNYDYLVIATGASPYVPKIKGLETVDFHTVRESGDVEKILASVKKAKTATVIGAGVIGIEMAGALRYQGLAVNLIEAGKHISTSVADSEFAEKIVDYLEENEIETFFDAKIKEIKKSNKKIKLNIGCRRKRIEIETDLLILATGVRPNLEIIKGTKIKATEKGIVVNEKMQTNVNDVYACGDCCVPLFSVTGEYRPSPLASSAIQQSKIVGYQIAGFPIGYAGSTGAFAFQTLGKEYAKVGLSESEARRRFKWVIVGRAQTTDVYKDLKRSQPLEVKLVFAGPSMKLVGYEAFGSGVITSAEVASFAIGQKTNILKMLKFNYIAHPSMTAWPFMNPLIMATEDAMGSIMNKFKKIWR